MISAWRERRLSYMVYLICLSNLMSTLPAIVAKVIDSEGKYVAVRALFKSLHWLQYSTDFLIYAASNRQYRQAYVLFLKTCCCCCRKKNEITP